MGDSLERRWEVKTQTKKKATMSVKMSVHRDVKVENGSVKVCQLFC